MDFSKISFTATRTTRPEFGTSAVHWIILLNCEPTPYTEGLKEFLKGNQLDRRTAAANGIIQSILDPDLVIQNQENSFGYPNKRSLAELVSTRVKVCPKEKNKLICSPPQIEDVLKNIALDANLAEPTYKEWCKSMGYEESFKEGYAYYLRCSDNARLLFRLELNIRDLNRHFAGLEGVRDAKT